MIFQAIRSIIFYILFFINTAIIAILIGSMAIFKRRWFPTGWAIAKYWGHSTKLLLRYIVGIRVIIKGEENIPEEGCIIAAKHQSDLDIFTIFPASKRPSFIAKKQLLGIPFFGWAARSFDTIPIDRKKRGGAIKGMISEAKKTVARGAKIIIFPEGTRKAPLADLDYRFGVAKIYEQLNVKVIPVALNNGLFWGRNALILWPGTATTVFLPPIEAGLDPKEMHKKMREVIEIHTKELILESYEKGLSRPITSELREKLEALKKEN